MEIQHLFRRLMALPSPLSEVVQTFYTVQGKALGSYLLLFLKLCYRKPSPVLL